MSYEWIKFLRTGVENRIHQLEPEAVFDPTQYEWRKDIEKQHLAIKNEAQIILEKIDQVTNFNAVVPNQRALTQNEMWKSFFILLGKEDIPQHQILCPETTKAIKQIPGVINAFFSILRPKTKIPAHRGPYAGILRYHLGVIIPEGDVGIKVDGKSLKWSEGKSLFFDDSFEHEAWNHTNEIRVVLFVDIIRPLPGFLAPLNYALLNCFRLTKNYQHSKKFIYDNQLDF